MRMRTLVIAFIVTASPGAAIADRGALTLELAPALTIWPAWGPGIGSGSGVRGTTAGGLVTLRYGLRHDLEVTAGGFYEAAADFTNPGTTLGSDGGPLTGTSRATVGRWGALLGARWVQGLEWRWFVGGEVGWTQQRLTKLDLIDVSDPSNPHSFGLGLANRTSGSVILAPLAGMEWQFADHWNVAVTPRVQLMLGGGTRLAFVLPVSLGYAWFGF